MSIITILLFSALILVVAYFTYGKFVARHLSMNDANVTPAHTLKDDVDYVPSKTPVVLGHHFASIAGAGPIVGPIIAVAFGWIPAIIWVLLGGIFFGAVHDMTSMVASLRHQGKSIGEVIHAYIGPFGKRLFLIFSFSTLILIIAVFTDIVAKTFVTVPAAASASIGFIGIAVLFGLMQRYTNIPFWAQTLMGIIIMYALVLFGDQLPLEFSYVVWVVILMVYVFIGSVAPVWILLQPRDYLNSFLLYGMMIFGMIGVFVTNPQIEMDSSITFKLDSLGYLFPVLFVTIACGALSGFHSLVASGTTSKQLNKERDALVVGYGGMLIESFLAILSIVAVIVLSREDYLSSLAASGPVTLFSKGLGTFISGMGIPLELAISFVALTVSAFALTSLDTCTRLARFALQELVDDQPGKVTQTINKNRYVSTFITVLLSVLLISSGEFTVLWPIFGSANQLLGALALLAVTVWLLKKGINPLITLVPMVFMFAVTLSSLLIFAWINFRDAQFLLGVIALALFALSVVLIVLARNSLKGYMTQQASASK